MWTGRGMKGRGGRWGVDGARGRCATRPSPNGMRAQRACDPALSGMLHSGLGALRHCPGCLSPAWARPGRAQDSSRERARGGWRRLRGDEAIEREDFEHLNCRHEGRPPLLQHLYRAGQSGAVRRAGRGGAGRGGRNAPREARVAKARANQPRNSMGAAQRVVRAARAGATGPCGEATKAPCAPPRPVHCARSPARTETQSGRTWPQSGRTGPQSGRWAAPARRRRAQRSFATQCPVPQPPAMSGAATTQRLAARAPRAPPHPHGRARTAAPRSPGLPRGPRAPPAAQRLSLIHI